MSVGLTLTRLFMRWVVKPKLRRSESVARARRELLKASDFVFRAPPFAWYREGRLVDLPVMWVETRPATKPTPSDKVILYLHGGGFIAGSPETHRKLLARLSWLTGLRICAPNYRKGPEHPFPAAVDDSIAAYRALLDQGYLAENIVIGGDSAGGGLCFSLLGAIEGVLPKPRAVFAFSPIVDLSFASASFDRNKDLDPLLPSDRRDLVIDNYLAGADPSAPAASPIQYDFPSPPPAFFQFSTTEILQDESLRMAEKLRMSGGEVTLDEWPDVPHVWVILDGWFPEAREALKRAADFIKNQF